jgi:hypothetical protein
VQASDFPADEADGPATGTAHRTSEEGKLIVYWMATGSDPAGDDSVRFTVTLPDPLPAAESVRVSD